MKPTTQQLVNFLSEITINTSFLNKLKIRYRPYLCPFDDLLSEISPGDKVADIGCGSGQFLLLASKFSAPSAVMGIEISDNLVNNANQLFSKYSKVPYRFLTFDGVHIPESLNTADIFFLVDVLHHVPPANQDLFLRNILQTMKPGARLILKDIDAASALVVFNKLHDLIFSGEIGKERKANDLEMLFRSLGVDHPVMQKRRMMLYPHFTLVIRK